MKTVFHAARCLQGLSIYGESHLSESLALKYVLHAALWLGSMVLWVLNSGAKIESLRGEGISRPKSMMWRDTNAGDSPTRVAYYESFIDCRYPAISLSSLHTNTLFGTRFSMPCRRGVLFRSQCSFCQDCKWGNSQYAGAVTMRKALPHCVQLPNFSCLCQIFVCRNGRSRHFSHRLLLEPH